MDLGETRRVLLVEPLEDPLEAPAEEEDAAAAEPERERVLAGA